MGDVKGSDSAKDRTVCDPDALTNSTARRGCPCGCEAQVVARPGDRATRQTPYVACFTQVEWVLNDGRTIPIDAVVHVLSSSVTGDELDHRVLTEPVQLTTRPEVMSKINPWVPLVHGPHGERNAAVPGFCPLATPEKPPLPEAEQLARRFHETYERLAPEFGYATRPESAVPWEEVPEKNRLLMIAVAAELIGETVRVSRRVVFDPASLPADEPHPEDSGKSVGER